MASMMLECALVRQLLANADVIVCMPLSNQRIIQRGFNQSAVLAQHLCKRNNARLMPGLIRKVFDTPAQSSLNRAQRLHQLTGSMRLTNGATNWIAGKKVVLIDDVMTTGASVQTATIELFRHQALQVGVLVFARSVLENLSG
jgi:ComF family protein